MKTVYSTGVGRVCPDCGKPASDCRCRRGDANEPAGDGIVRVRRETKGRKGSKGRGVVVVTGVPLAGDALKALAKDLKRTCGSGGTVKDGTIEIQGDLRDQVVAELRARGFTVRG